jgi:hypothetical protein
VIPSMGEDCVTKLYKVLDALACWLVDEAEDWGQAAETGGRQVA